MVRIYVISQGSFAQCWWQEEQLKYVQFLLCVINNDYVRLQICYTELSRDGSSSCGFPAWQVTVYFESWVHIGHNEVDEIVVSPSVAISVKHLFAAVQVVICGASITTEFALVTGSVFPSLQICWGGQCIYACI